MFVTAATLSAATTAGTVGVPYFHLGSFDKLGIPIQAFGVIVAIGVLIGAALLRRYAEWHGVSDDHIRGLTGWITVTGFIGAHVFDVVAYQWNDLMKDPVLLIKLWKGISSYGGFLGGALGFAMYVWWKRLPVRLMADIAVVGLLPAFSIGRIGCTVVSDHLGARLGNPEAWYSFLAMEYPRDEALKDGVSGLAQLYQQNPDAAAAGTIDAWNLGLVELVYLVPVNLIVLWLAFRPDKRLPAGFIAVLVGVLYAPVRFFMDYLRPEASDPRYLGFTFAQWASFLAFGVSVYAASKILRGKAAETVTRTSGEAQAKLKVLLKDDDDKDTKDTKDKAKGKTDEPKKRPPTEPPDEEPEADKPTDKPADEPADEPEVHEKAKPASEMADEKPDAKPAEAKPPAMADEPADEGAEVDPKEVATAAKPKPAGGGKGGGGKSKKKKR